MEKVLTRYSWVMNLVALAAIAFFGARGVGEIVASSASEMMRGSGTGPSAPADIRRPRTPRHSFAKPDGTPILERNIFDSLVGPVLPTAEDTDGAKPMGDGELPLIPCPAGQNKLLSTVASSNNPTWSFASVQSGQTTMMYRVGDQLDGRTVIAISWRYMLLRGTSDECYLDMYGEEGSLTRATKPRESGEGSVDSSLASGIEVNGENERTVKRALVDDALANPTKFARSVRVRPYTVNGENKGFRIRKIEKGSPLEMLGAQRGDIIHSVNGVELTSVDKALAAYQSLRSESRLTFSITRKGKPMDLLINIQ
jgi:general secretion pathway protein C